MSLKAFHVFFITVATVFAASFTLWALQQTMTVGGATAVALATLGMLFSVALPVYGAWFLRKTKEVSFL